MNRAVLLFAFLVAFCCSTSSAVQIRVDFEGLIVPEPRFERFARRIGNGKVIGTLGVFDVRSPGDAFTIGGPGVRAEVAGLNTSTLNGPLIHVPVFPHDLSIVGSDGDDVLIGVRHDASYIGTRYPPDIVFTSVTPDAIEARFRFENVHRGLFLNSTGVNPGVGRAGGYHGLGAIPGEILVELWANDSGEQIAWFANLQPSGLGAMNGSGPLSFTFTIIPTPASLPLLTLACVGLGMRRDR